MAIELKIKICGMRDEANVNEVSCVGVDYLGFIFYSRSPRYVGRNFKMPSLPSSISPVAVFVDEPLSEIRKITTLHHISHVQLHGGESVETCAALRSEGLKVIKVFSVDNNFDVSAIYVYRDTVDFFLFDTKGAHYGGNGRVFNWKILSDLDGSAPYFLSGGLAPENIGELISLEMPGLFGIDVNSGVEIQPALKDVRRVRQVKSIVEGIIRTKTSKI